TGASILLPLLVMIGFALLGGYDDWEGIQRSRGADRGLGIPPRAKLIGQIVLAGAASIVISLYDGGFQYANQIAVPLIGISIPLHPILFIPLCTFIIVSMSN